jgi:hypothetical protein
MKKLKLHKLFVTMLLLDLLVISCQQGVKQTLDKQTVSDQDRKLAANIDSTLHSLPPGLRLATFDVDATPPVGDQLPYLSVNNIWDLGLRAKGIVLLGAGQPIIMCAIDWGGIGNDAYDAFRSALANAAGTISERVAVHTLHQHDAPWADFSIERILKEADINPMYFESRFHREVIHSLETAIRNSLNHSQPITHVGLGKAQVYQVASNRRILGSDGRVRAGRMSSCKDPGLRAEPEGVIDPIVSLVSFWNNDKPLAVLSYYATHPQSYYGTGIPNPDFPGIARFLRQLDVPDALHIHFTGAGGNVAAGKYNDGSHENRLILAERLADGMKRAWEATIRECISTESVAWTVEPLTLPPTRHIEKLEPKKQISQGMEVESIAARLAFQERCKAGKQTDVSCLKLSRARILHMPGELFVEYQLAAKAERKDLFVAMAAYGDYGPCYIGTAKAYEQGGYETGTEWSFVTPEVEDVLMAAIRKLLNGKP